MTTYYEYEVHGEVHEVRPVSFTVAVPADADQGMLDTILTATAFHEASKVEPQNVAQDFVRRSMSRLNGQLFRKEEA